MKYLMLILKIVLFALALPVLYFVGVILLAQFARFQPEEISLAQQINEVKESLSLPKKDTFEVITWNIGYAGLGKESDFFYDGGKMVRPSLNVLEKNYHGIIQTILTWRAEADFILLQEVDSLSRRSYEMLQVNSIADATKRVGYRSAVFAKNYDVKFVPMPLTSPMGKVSSGILSLSKYVPSSAERISFPGEFPWPKGLFFLNRCFSVERYPCKGKELVLINTHNSAFDGGTLKEKEMEYLRNFLLNEEAKGNFVVVGGDWNQVPPGYVGNPLAGYEETPAPIHFPNDKWKWAADLEHRSNRKVDTPYLKGSTYTTILDFFLLSPNISILEVKGIETAFEYSDHQPVRLRFAVGN